MYFGRKTHRGAAPSISPTKFSTLATIASKADSSRSPNSRQKDLLPPLPSSPPPTLMSTQESSAFFSSSFAATAKASSSLVGLSFSEFVEGLGIVAAQGLQQENYHAVFPTMYSKVLAVLTVWGLADLHKLEEVRCIRTEEVY